MDYTDEFETFWSLYPKRWHQDLGCYIKRKKWPAFVKWRKLPQAIRDDCLAKVKMIRRAEGTPRDCVTWLNQKGWGDIEIEKPKPLPAELVPNMKTVPDDNRSTSDKVNEARNALEGK